MRPTATRAAPPVPGATPSPRIDRAVRSLASRAADWAGLPPGERATLLDRVRRDLCRVAPDWVTTSLAAKGAAPGTMAEAEEWLYVATVLRAVRLLGSAPTDPGRGSPPPRSAGRLPNGQLAVQVFPGSRVDRFTYRGLTGEVWMEPGRTAADLAAPGAGTAGVAAVLGAGNASMLPAVDVLHQLLVEGRVVVLKPNPVNAYLGPLIEEAFGAFVRSGFLRLVYGGAAEGAYLCRHPQVDALHLTGSHATFRAIAADGDGVTARGTSAHRKPMTSELGNVSPVIIVPGPWSARDVERQAEGIATWLVANAGYGCLTPRVLVQHRQWPLRRPLLDALSRALGRTETRRAYYPGAEQRFARFIGAHPDAWLLGRPRDGDLPWAVIPDVDATATGDVCFREEAFCGLIAETALAAADPAAFVHAAVSFANTVLWGTLNATLLVHPASLSDPAVARAVEEAVANLRYGTVSINSAAFAAYHLQVLPWGAFPPRDATEIESGFGKTANSLRLRHVQKSVLRGPFSSWPDPLTASARRPDRVARRLAASAASGSAAALPALVGAALRGSVRRGRRR